MMTTLQISKRCKELAKEFWGLDFNIPVEINKRLTRAMGRMTYSRDVKGNKPLKLSFSQNLLSNNNPDSIDSVIAHEVTHWALCILNKPFADKHPYFEAELKRVGGSSTRTLTLAGLKHKIVCCNCEKTVFLGSETKKNNLMKKVNNSTTMCCGWSYKYVGTETVKDTYTKSK